MAADVLVVLVLLLVNESVVVVVELVEVVKLEFVELLEFCGGGVQTRGVTREVTAVLFWVLQRAAKFFDIRNAVE